MNTSVAEVGVVDWAINSTALESTKKMFFIALGIDIAVTAIAVASDFWVIDMLDGARAGGPAVSPSVVSNIDFWASFLKLMVLTAIGVGWTLTRWLRACYMHAKQSLHATGFCHEKWTTWGWIVPFWNLFKPYQVLSEIYRVGDTGSVESDGWKKSPSSGMLLLWWLFWVVAHMVMMGIGKEILNISSRADLTLNQVVSVYNAQIVVCAISLVVAGLWFVVANSLTSRLLARSSKPFKREVLNNSATVVAGSAVYIAPFTEIEATKVQAQPTVVHKHGAPNQRGGLMNSAVVSDQPFDEDAIYATIAVELESGNTDKGLWTRVFAECEGDEKQTKVLYIKRRAEKLKAAESVRREQVAVQQAELLRLEAVAKEKAEELLRRNAALGDTELADAVWNGNLATAIRLLGAGVSPFGSDANGVSLLDLAKKRGDQQMIDLLNSYGAGNPAQTPKADAESTKGSEAPLSPNDTQQMAEHGITFDGERYTYGEYKYDKLSDAVNYGERQSTSVGRKR